MEELAVYRQGLLSALEGVVPALSKIMDDIPAQAWLAPGESYEQTPHFVLSRLLVQERQLFNNNIRSICTEDNPLLHPFDDDAWMESQYRPNQPAQEIFNAFAQLHQKEVEWLRSLTPGDWSRTARHPWWGIHAVQWWVELQLEYSHWRLKELTAFAAG